MKRLRLLWELHARGTIAAVAEALNYSPSAVSQQLALLEKEAGVQLLRKSGRTLELTGAAEALVTETSELLAGLERAEAHLRTSDPVISGTLRVAVFQTALLAMLPQVLKTLRVKHPKLRIEMVQYEPGEGLWETWARAFDVVVAEQYPGHAAPHLPGLDRVPLTHDPIHLALPAADSGDEAFDSVTDIAGARGLPWVMEPEPAGSRHWAEQMCRSAGFEPDVRYETADLQAHVRLIETGNAIALLPGFVHAGWLPKFRLVPLPNDPARTVFTAARKSISSTPALAAFRRALQAEASRLVRSPVVESTN